MTRREHTSTGDAWTDGAPTADELTGDGPTGNEPTDNGPTDDGSTPAGPGAVSRSGGVSRRRLLGLLSAVGVGGLAGCGWTDLTGNGDQSSTGPVALPELLLPVAAIDDGMRLVQVADDSVPDAVAAYLVPDRAGGAGTDGDTGVGTPNQQLARSAAVFPALGDFAATFVEGNASLIERTADDVTSTEGRFVALVLGTLLYRGVGSTLAGRHEDLGPDPAPTERSVYHDATFLRRRTRALGGDPEAATAAEIESLFEQCWRRSLVRAHTVTPDGSDVDAWLRAFLEWRDTMDEVRERLAAAYRDPDPALVERYVDEPNVHDPADPLLELVRDHHRGEVDPDRLEPALEAAADGSLYARAVREGFLNVRAAGAYLDGEIDADALAERIRE